MMAKHTTAERAEREARLAAREAALGLGWIEDAESEQPSPVPALPGTQAERDRFGNRIEGACGPLGQYRIVSRRDGGEARVCGEADSTKHLLWWEYDAGERRYVCARCWPEMAKPQRRG